MKYFNSASFRFYHSLNDFLPENKRWVPFEIEFFGNPSVKDKIESLNVPHTEIDLIIANGIPVDFKYKLKDGDYISVYPEFKKIILPDKFHLLKKPEGNLKFICDVQLGKLAKYLRLLGFDTLYSNNFKTEEIIKQSNEEERIILTRSILLLKNNKVQFGYWIRSENPVEQLIQILIQLELISELNPFKKCSLCNGELVKVDKELIKDELLSETKKYFDKFYICNKCKKIYWQGSHYKRINIFFQEIRKSL